jgi:hypothetical protein
MRKILVVCINCLLILTALPAEEDYEDLFEEEMIIEEPEETITEEEAPEEEFLTSERGVDWGGHFISTFTTSWIWTGGYPVFKELVDPDKSVFDTELGASLFFDARPDEDFRVFGKAKFYYPFSTSGDNSDPDINDIIYIHELFSDWNIKDAVFFRVGKHTIKWGVGYFFSPADVVNLTRIDPEDPEEELVGPVSVKMQIPIRLHNLYFYVIANDITKPREIGFAPKLEFVIKNVELGVGGFYQYGRAPKAMMTMTFPIVNVHIFTEAVFSYGSDRTYIRDTGRNTGFPTYVPIYETYEEKKKPFFSGTLGFRYIHSDINLSLLGQYYYTMEGYKNPDLVKDVYNGIKTDPPSIWIEGDLSLSDLYRPGRHYGAAMINWFSIVDSDFGLSLFWIGNLRDGSGWISPAFAWNPSDYVGFTLSVLFYYGEEGDEFTPNGSGITLRIESSIGAGRF